MKLSCDVVIDLVSLYKDKLASDDSVAAVDEHLKECPSCRRYYKQYDKIKDLEATPVKLYHDNNHDLFNALSAKLRRRHLISTATIGSIIALSVSVTLFCVIKEMQKNERDNQRQ